LGQPETLTVQCNIDQRGRRVRLVTGAAVDATGAILILTGVLRNELWLIVAGAFVSVAGLFVIFEGVRGWCVVRAMGYKTKL
jgi:hypothetical protein